jgi:hypothetical protein
MVVAYQRGRRGGAFLFGLYCFVGMSTDVIQAWIAETRARAVGGCCFVVQSASDIALWQVLAIAALVLGVVFAHRTRTLSRTAATILEAAGAYSLGSLPLALTFQIDPRWLPFEAVHAPTEIHASIVLLQSVLAGLVVACRGTRSLRLPAAAGLIAGVGLLTVLFDDLSTLVRVPLYGWTYWPQSSVLVPAAGAALVLLVALARRAFTAVSARSQAI